MLWVDDVLPVAGAKYVRIRNAGANTSALYPIRSLEHEGARLKIMVQDTIILSKGIVESVDEDVIESRYPLPFGKDGSVAQSQSTPFTGKLVFGKFGGQAVVVSVRDLKVMDVKTLVPFGVGERFDILDCSVGDECQLV